MNQYYGKYRAVVVEVDDPEKRGRIQVLCPRVLQGYKSAWCEPCIPVAYDNGGDVALPKIGEFVWVEFEEGDPNHPIYTGGLWSKNRKPNINVKHRQIEWSGCKITMTDNNVLTIENGAGAYVRLQGSEVTWSSQYTNND